MLIRRGRTFKFAFKNLHGTVTPSLEVAGEKGETEDPGLSLYTVAFSGLSPGLN